MDRGVKIAIFVASIAALCLGLIWDQVLSHARVIVEETADDPLAAEVMDANIGSPEIGRLEPSDDLAPQFDTRPVDDTPGEPEGVSEVVAVSAEPTEYTVKDGDSYWKLAHVTFKDRGLSSEDIKRANGGKELRTGDKFMVPAGKATGAAQPKPQEPKPAASSEATEYTVQDGDSWWKIAYVHFKGRGLTSDDLIKANPGAKLVAGNKVKIPAK
jgi:nucleoid-associated protein YgaU